MKKNLRRIAVFIAFAVAICSADASGFISQAASTTKNITLNYPAKEMIVGQTIKLKVDYVKPKGASKDVTWKSSDTKVATVSPKGVIKAKKAGKATITATSKSNNKVKATCKVTVLKYKVPELRLEKVSGNFACGESLLKKKWKEIYPYYCKYIGEPEKISAEGMTLSWDDAINDPNLVDFKAETNTVYMGPLPHHDNFNKNNHYDYEPFVMQVLHESGHMFNQQGDDLARFDFGQWVWEATSIIAEVDYYNEVYGEYNRHGESRLDMINLCGKDAVNGVKNDGNKYSRSIVDSSAAAAFYYMSNALSTKGTYDFWRKVYALRMENYKATQNGYLSWDEFADILDKAAGSKKIDGMSASKWLLSQAVSNYDGPVGDYLVCYPERPADSFPSFYIAAFNRYTKDDGMKYEKSLDGTKVDLTLTDPSGKTVAKGSTTIKGDYVLYDKLGDFRNKGLKNLTAMKVTVTATINGKKHKSVTYQTYVNGNSDNDRNSTYIVLLDKNGNILTNVKASDIKISGAKAVTKSALKRGCLVLKSEPGDTYTIKYKGKTYKISQPECRRVYPLKLS